MGVEGCVHKHAAAQAWWATYTCTMGSLSLSFQHSADSLRLFPISSLFPLSSPLSRALSYTNHAAYAINLQIIIDHPAFLTTETTLVPLPSSPPPLLPPPALVRLCVPYLLANANAVICLIRRIRKLAALRFPPCSRFLHSVLVQPSGFSPWTLTSVTVYTVPIFT